MREEDKVEFTCNGRIGGDVTTQLEWKKTGSTGSLTKFQPSAAIYANIANETKGSAVAVEAECTNSRTTTLRYKITNNDKQAIQFQCYIESQGVNINSSIFYIRAYSMYNLIIVLLGLPLSIMCYNYQRGPSIVESKLPSL